MSSFRGYILRLLAISVLSAQFSFAGAAAATETATFNREGGEEFCEAADPFECSIKKRPKCIKIRICLHLNGCEELDAAPKCERDDPEK